MKISVRKIINEFVYDLVEMEMERAGAPKSERTMKRKHFTRENEMECNIIQTGTKREISRLGAEIYDENELDYSSTFSVFLFFSSSFIHSG